MALERGKDHPKITAEDVTLIESVLNTLVSNINPTEQTSTLRQQIVTKAIAMLVLAEDSLPKVGKNGIAVNGKFNVVNQLTPGLEKVWKTNPAIASRLELLLYSSKEQYSGISYTDWLLLLAVASEKEIVGLMRQYPLYGQVLDETRAIIAKDSSTAARQIQERNEGTLLANLTSEQAYAINTLIERLMLYGRQYTADDARRAFLGKVASVLDFTLNGKYAHSEGA